MKSLLQELTYWEEASIRPGILGRAAWSNVVSMRKSCAEYFEQIALSIDVPGQENHYGVIETHVVSALNNARPMLEMAYQMHARKALLISADRDVFEESSGARANLGVSRNNQDSDLAKKLDRLGLTGQQAVDYIIQHGAQLVKDIDTYSMKIIRANVANGIENQLGVDGTVRLIKSEFRDMKTARARSIATTEMNDAMSESALNKIRSVGLDGKRWINSPGACPLCMANAAQGVIPIDQPFASGHMRPPGHPGKCRCAVSGGRLVA